MAKFEITAKVKQKVVNASDLDSLVDDFVYHPWRYIDLRVRDVTSSLFPSDVSFSFDNRLRIKRDQDKILLTGSPEFCSKAVDVVLDLFNNKD